MRKILFDGIATQGTKDSPFHGGAEYAKFILNAALQHGFIFNVVFNKNKIIDPFVENLLSSYPANEVIWVASKSELYQIIETGKYDRFYSALPYDYDDYPCHTELIGVIHGLRSIELPWDYYRYQYDSLWYRRSLGWVVSNCMFIQSVLKHKHLRIYKKLLHLRNASYITVSNHSKYSLLHFFPFLKEENIKVYYSPFSVNKEKSVERENYYMMVSGNRYEKNIYRAILAFDLLFSNGRLQGKNVVITGCKHQPFLKKIKNKERFRLLPYVSNDELEKLYKKAYCFMYPSLNEGFGYPPLKAMAYGVPVIASSSTSIPEVCDNAGCYFCPTSIDEMCNRILQIDTDEELRAALIEKGYKRLEVLLKKQSKQLEEELHFIFG